MTLEHISPVLLSHRHYSAGEMFPERKVRPEGSDDGVIPPSYRFDPFQGLKELRHALVISYHHAAISWYRIQIGNREHYSVERLLAFRDYRERTSRTRVLLICLLTPVPALVVMLLIECLPLRSPEEGWKANKMMWLRMLISSSFVAGGVVFLSKSLINEAAISTPRTFGIIFASAICYTVGGMLLAATWRYPIPFGLVVMVCPFVGVIMVFFLLSIDLQELRTNKKLQKQLRGLMLAVSAQACLVVAYPSFNAIFLQLSNVEQAIFVFVLPVIKFFTKQITVHVASHVKDVIGVAIVFSVDVFNVLYVAISMQSARSPLTTILVMSSDAFHIVLALRTIYYHTKTIERVKDHTDLVTRLLVAIEKLEPRAEPYTGAIRLLGLYKLPISPSSKIFLEILDSKIKTQGKTVLATTKVLQEEHPATGSTAISVGPAVQLIHPLFNTTSFTKSSYRAVHPKLNATKSQSHSLVPELSRLQTLDSFSPRCLSSAHCNSKRLTGRSLSSKSMRVRNENTAEEGLQVLFHCEYIIMSEYVECVLPLFYSAYLAGLYRLPTAAYYPFTKTLTAGKMSSTLLQLVSYGSFEFVSFAGLHLLLKQRLGYSPAYQLAFVLETHVVLLQSLLFIWIIFILQLTLEHGGVDFNAPFK